MPESVSAIVIGVSVVLAGIQEERYRKERALRPRERGRKRNNVREKVSMREQVYVQPRPQDPEHPRCNRDAWRCKTLTMKGRGKKSKEVKIPAPRANSPHLTLRPNVNGREDLQNSINDVFDRPQGSSFAEVRGLREASSLAETQGDTGSSRVARSRHDSSLRLGGNVPTSSVAISHSSG